MGDLPKLKGSKRKGKEKKGKISSCFRVEQRRRERERKQRKDSFCLLGRGMTKIP